jgi:AraC-like DNA-binding protein
VTVADVAFRWGFNHLGRFAAFYRTRYGVPPSRTLRDAT